MQTIRVGEKNVWSVNFTLIIIFLYCSYRSLSLSLSLFSLHTNDLYIDLRLSSVFFLVANVDKSEKRAEKKEEEEKCKRSYWSIAQKLIIFLSFLFFFISFIVMYVFLRDFSITVSATHSITNKRIALMGSNEPLMICCLCLITTTVSGLRFSIDSIEMDEHFVSRLTCIVFLFFFLSMTCSIVCVWRVLMKCVSSKVHRRFQLNRFRSSVHRWR